MEIPKLGESATNMSYLNERSLDETSVKRKTRGFLNYAGIMVGVVIMFVTTVALTTDIKIGNIFDFASLGLSFFVLTLCTYLMYISCADSGMRAGVGAEAYTSILAIYAELKQKIISMGHSSLLQEFCHEYVVDELKRTRIYILSGYLEYDVYAEMYMNKDSEFIDSQEGLSKIQKAVIKHANKIKPIKLTPEMLLRSNQGMGNRAPLSVSSDKKKQIGFITKFGKTFAISAVMVCMSFEVMVAPNWATFAAIALKLLMVIVNGFTGYKFGYENIVIDRVAYVESQVDRMREYLKFAEEKLLIT